MTLLAACSGSTQVTREPLPAQTSTAGPVSTVAPIASPPAASPVATAVRAILGTPTSVRPCSIVEYLTGYPTPSPAESIAFLSDPDPANGGVRYTGKIGIGPYLGDSPYVNYIIVIANESALPLTVRTTDFRLTARQSGGSSLGLPYFYSKGTGSFGAGAGERATEYRILPGQMTAALFQPMPASAPGTFDVEWAIQGALGRVAVPVITPMPLPPPTPLPPC